MKCVAWDIRLHFGSPRHRRTQRKYPLKWFGFIPQITSYIHHFSLGQDPRHVSCFWLSTGHCPCVRSIQLHHQVTYNDWISALPSPTPDGLPGVPSPGGWGCLCPTPRGWLCGECWSNCSTLPWYWWDAWGCIYILLSLWDGQTVITSLRCGCKCRQFLKCTASLQSCPVHP